MTTEKLREEIAELEYVLHSKYYGRKYGYHKWDDLPPVMRDEIYSTATQILTACKKAGLVFVVKDAELPKNPYDQQYHSPEETKRWIIHNNAQKGMLKAGFKMWEEIEQ